MECEYKIQFNFDIYSKETCAIYIYNFCIQPKAEKPKPAPKVFEHKKVVIPPKEEKNIIPDYVAEAAQRSGSASKAELEKEMLESE